MNFITVRVMKLNRALKNNAHLVAENLTRQLVQLFEIDNFAFCPIVGSVDKAANKCSRQYGEYSATGVER